MYLSLSNDDEFLAGVREACRRHGWPVLAASEEPPGRRLQALRLADACILDISVDGLDAGVELGLALCEGRPVIALRSHSADSTPFLDELTREHSAVRQVSYRGLDDCLAVLEGVLSEGRWQEQVAQAAPSG